VVRYAQAAADAERRLPDLPPGARVRPARPGDADALAPLLRGPDPLARRLARGDIGMVAEVAGRAVGCAWLSAGPMRVDQFLLRFDARGGGDRYLYGFIVLPGARDAALIRALVRATLGAGLRDGATRFVWDMNRHNPVRALVYMLRGRPVVEMRVIVLLGRWALVVRRRPVAADERLRPARRDRLAAAAAARGPSG
jgi:hypothetical protein